MLPIFSQAMKLIELRECRSKTMALAYVNVSTNLAYELLLSSQ